MPLGTLHTVHGIIERRPGYRFFLAVHGGGEWELEANRRLSRYDGCSVTVEGVRTGFNRLEVVRIKRDGEDWPADQAWTKWFKRRQRQQRGDRSNYAILALQGIVFVKYIVPMVGAALLAGCVSMGTDYDSAAVDRLQVGMTKAQVIQILGQPNQVIANSDGGERLIWIHSTGSIFGANARSVGLPFGRDGRLTDVPRQAAQ